MLCSDAVGMKAHVPDMAMSWRVPAWASPAFMYKQKKGGLMYQSISKNASSELCAYPDKPGSPKVAYQSELMPPLGTQDRSKSPSATPAMDADVPNTKFLIFCKAQNPNPASGFTSCL